MNSLSVKVTDQDFNPIEAVVYYTDINGASVGSEYIPAGSPYTLNPGFVDNDATFSVSFTSQGFYDFDTDKYHLADFSDITLQRKPNHGIEIVAGAAILAILAFFYK